MLFNIDIKVFATERKESSCLRKSFLLFCGLDESQKDRKPTEVAVHLTNIDEEPIPSLIVNLSCLFMLCVMVFLFGFYG